MAKRFSKKPPDETLFKRIRMFIGPTDWSNYTIEGDVRANMKRRQMGDIGLTAQRYTLVLYGNTQQIENRAVGARNPTHGHRSVRMETGPVVSLEAARRKHARRESPSPRQGWPTGEPGAGGLDDREDRSHRQS